MKKILLLIGLIIMVGEVFPQPVVNRASSNNTVQDGRGMWQYNMFAPRYIDTTSANVLKGVDSCGAVIFTYDVMSLWTRACSPKRWVRVGEVLKFGVAGEDDAGGGISRGFNGGNAPGFQITNLQSYSLSDIGTLAFIARTVGGAYSVTNMSAGTIVSQGASATALTNVSMVANDGVDIYHALSSVSPFRSQITVNKDSIRFLPFLGKINIDSLRSATDSTDNKPMSYNPATGEWKYLTYWPGSGGGAATDVEALITDTYPEGGRFVGAILELNRTKWTNPGLQDPRDKRLFDNGNIPEAIPFSSVDNTNTRYVGFPSATSCRQTMWATYKGAVTHVTPGSLPIMMSQDGGKKWDSINVLHPYGNDPNITNIEDTIWYCHTSGYTAKILIGYSTDGFKTKVLADSVSMPGEASYPFDKMLKFPSGKICFLTYLSHHFQANTSLV